MVIEIINATKKYGDHKALDGVTIKVEKGKIQGLIGKNGTGKTTLIKAIVGIHELTSGTIKILGEEVYDNESIKREIGYVADKNQLFKDYTINKMIKFYQEVYPKFSVEKFDYYNEKVKLFKEKKIRTLSKGMQTKLAIMLNLARKPEVLILDEPTSGLDVMAKKEILGFIIEAVEEEQVTVLISSHHLSDLEMLCDDITLLSDGKKVENTASINEVREKLKKIQVVFKNDADLSLLDKDENIIDISNIGRVYYIVTKDLSKTESNIKEIGFNMIEELPMALEEIFIYINK
ncbi:MAG: hypothetical protein ATN31_09700 [Candidatus Epulonipiscioides saccharophilum]|nr:MAG: hypothetical protein ATN31_09700 [Epulopiscium sp. AS2M-Bin001]